MTKNHVYTIATLNKFLKFYYLGECHCQNDLLEHYDDQSILHCYEEYTQGPCMEEQIFYQPVELDDNGAQKNPICIFSIRELFPKSCPSGERRDQTSGKCRATSSHSNNNMKKVMGGYPTVLEFVRHKKSVTNSKQKMT